MLDPVNGLPIWKGDEASTASVYFLVYDPAGPPTLVRDARQQIGYFRDSGSVETGATRISNNVEQLAQAIVHGPKLLFLDEPTNGLDPPHRRRMIRLVKEIRDTVVHEVAHHFGIDDARLEEMEL